MGKTKADNKSIRFNIVHLDFCKKDLGIDGEQKLVDFFLESHYTLSTLKDVDDNGQQDIYKTQEYQSLIDKKTNIIEEMLKIQEDMDSVAEKYKYPYKKKKDAKEAELHQINILIKQYLKKAKENTMTP